MVADTRRLRPGDLVFLVVPASEPLLAAGWWGSTAERGTRPIAAAKGSSVVRWPVEIAGVAGPHRDPGATPALRRPPAAGPAGDGRASLLQDIPVDQTIRDVGVEQLTLVMKRRPAVGRRPLRGAGGERALRLEWSLLPQHGPRLRPPGHRGRRRPGAWRTMGSKNISLEEIELRSEGLPAGLNPHRALAIRSQSHDVLVQGVSMDARWRGVRLEGSGFALSRGRGHFSGAWRGGGGLGPDRADRGGRGPAGVTGRRSQPADRLVGWNIEPPAGAEDRRPALPVARASRQPLRSPAPPPPDRPANALTDYNAEPSEGSAPPAKLRAEASSAAPHANARSPGANRREQRAVLPGGSHYTGGTPLRLPWSPDS